MTNEDKASRYHRLRRRAELVGTLIAGAFLLTLLLTGATFRLREISASIAGLVASAYQEQGTAPAYAVLLTLLMSIIGLPTAYYAGFTLEHRYGLSTETRRVWVQDYLKGMGITMVLGMIGAGLIYASLRESQDWWWVISAAAFICALVVIARVAPVIVLPMFYRITPLDRPSLRERLLTLATRARTKVVGVFVWGLSAHTRKANAALAGMGGSRRILLSDTLLADYSDDEIEVVLAHELSHHLHRDLWTSMALQSGLLLVSFYVAHQLLQALEDRIALRGFDDPAGLPLLLLTLGACSLLALPLSNAISRAHERRADRYALELTRQPAAFISAMKRLSQQNLAEEQPSALITWLFYSHPPIRDRIAFARAWEAERMKQPTGTTESEVA